MPKTDFKSVDEYISSQPGAVRAILEQVRSAIRSAAPEAQELISYRMPAYLLHGSRLLYFAASKGHFAIYASMGPVVAAFPKELARYKVAKGTIRFPLSEPVPVKLIGRITKFRVKEAAGRGKAKAIAAKNRRRPSRRSTRR